MSIRQNFCLCAVLCKIEELAGFEQPIFEQRPKRDPDLLPFYDFHRLGIRFPHGVDAFLRDPDIFFLTFDSDPIATQFLGNRACCAAPKKRIEDHVSGIR